MIWPGRRSTELDADLRARAESAAGRFASARAPTRGGLTGVIVRALGLRERFAADEPAGASADTAEVEMLREELVQELDRAAQRGAEVKREPDPESHSAVAPVEQT